MCATGAASEGAELVEGAEDGVEEGAEGVAGELPLESTLGRASEEPPPEEFELVLELETVVTVGPLIVR